ncbi:hypothetical protein TNCV_2723391 [Trichonephila clavipes]|nr:hypothetical protein TNCV_2723391 [Trichonephila clavipes]
MNNDCEREDQLEVIIDAGTNEVNGIAPPPHPSSSPMALKSVELWFQQDGATCHTARATIGDASDLLKDTLGDRLISRFGKIGYP